MPLKRWRDRHLVMQRGSLMTDPSAGCLSAELVGQSSATRRLRADIERVAVFASTVLITGPSGTGKEIVARQIHRLSPRRQQPFVPVDCASLTGELMASQLFGHVAGAFTGANCHALGCFRAADGGTLFLDEIGELEMPMQAKLLRVLQERVVTPVGCHQGSTVDVRVVAATNRDLRADVLAGHFREDLYYRLDVVQLRTTALRDRLGDIPVLVAAFLSDLAAAGLPRCTVSGDGLRELMGFSWPGNVRQLRNVLEQAVIDSPTPLIAADLLQRIISLAFSMHGEALPALVASSHAAIETLPELATADQGVECDPAKVNEHWPTLDELECQHIVETLAHTFFNRSAAARMLGITRQALLRKIKRYGISAEHPCPR